MTVRPANNRHRITSTDEGLRIIIPHAWRPGALLATTVFVLGIAVMAMIGLDVNQRHPSPAFAIIFFALFLVLFAGTFWSSSVYAWLWHVRGKEIVQVDATAITLTRRVLGLERPRRYLASHVRDLRAVPRGGMAGDPSMWQAFGIDPCTLAFDYGARTVRFGVGLDEAEARQIVAAVGARFAGYTDSVGANLVFAPQRQASRSQADGRSRESAARFPLDWLHRGASADVVPAAPRHTAQDTGTALRFTAPNRRDPVSLALGGLMAAFWFVIGLVGAVGGIASQVDRPTPWFMWLCVGTLLAVIMAVALAPTFWLIWQFAGRETLEVDGQTLSIRRSLRGIGRTRRYVAGEIEGLRVAFQSAPQRRELGRILFEHRGRTRTWGAGLDEAEARQIVSAIAARFPSYTRPHRYPPRHTLTDDGAVLRITVRLRLRPLNILLLVAQLSVPVMAILSYDTVAQEFPIRDRADIITYAVMFGWVGVIMLAVTLLALRQLHVELATREVIDVDHDGISLRRGPFGVGRPRRYAAEHVCGLRASPTGDPHAMDMFRHLTAGHPAGTLAFDYGARAIRFGEELPETEAQEIVTAIARRFPRYGERASGGRQQATGNG